jgi:NAD(P)H dehydrogenase (quinone)
MKILVVAVHPRPDSLTFAVADAFSRGVAARGHVVEHADLYRERFDPALGTEDEPAFGGAHKPYTDAVRAEMARIERNEATVMVFPVWWWSMPAMLKGWVDRVWNDGWAYGAAVYPHRRVWMLAIAGITRAAAAKRHYDIAMRIQLEVGILEYCGVAEPRLELLYGSIEGSAYPPAILERVAALAADF